jgi:hypothetical protein
MADAGQFYLPIEICLTPSRGNILCIADAAAIRTSETRPFLPFAPADEGQPERRKEAKGRRFHRFH